MNKPRIADPDFCHRALRQSPRSRVDESIRARKEFVPAFTLIELMVVIAIILVVSSLVVPALPSLLAAQGVTAAASDTASILSLARTEAMSRGTYVYVGFADVTNDDGNRELRIAAVASVDGTTSSLPANLKPLTKLVAIDSVALTDSSTLPTAASTKLGEFKPPPDDKDFVTKFPTGINFEVGKQKFDNLPVIIFSPQGELISTTSSTDPKFYEFSPYALIGLQQARGTTTDSDAPNWAVVVYHGGTGNVETVRP